MCFRVDPKMELKGRAPFMGRNQCPALIIGEMISHVNNYEQLICARLLDYFSSKTHWNRSLWGAGTILALREVLEASEAQSQGHLTDKTIKGAVVTALRLLRDDPGMGTQQERETLSGLLRFDGEPRNDLPFQGLEYEAIKETVERSLPVYLERWSRAIATDRPAQERASRAIASHLLDIGFHSDYLHRWWTWHTKNPRDIETPLANVVTEMAAIAFREETTFSVLIPFPTPLQPPSGLLPPESWIDATHVSKWLTENISTNHEGIRQQGGLLLTVLARDPESAVQFAADRVEMFAARVLLSLRKSVQPLPVAWVKGKKQPFSIERRLRGIKIGAMHRENRIWLESEPDPYIDPAIELLAPLQSGTATAAIAGGWAAIESLLSEPLAKRADPAERLATIVACSFPRAELTDLAYAAMELGGDFAERLKSLGSNREKAALVAESILDGTFPTLPSWSDRAAVERMRELLAAPRETVFSIRNHIHDTFARLYRQRNLILHAGKTQAVALRSTLRAASPLVGAGLDRIAHGRFAGNLKPLQLAGRARTAIGNLSADEPLRCVDLLGV